MIRMRTIVAVVTVHQPWDMTTVTKGATTTLFVSTVLNGGANDRTSRDPSRNDQVRRADQARWDEKGVAVSPRP